MSARMLHATAVSINGFGVLLTGPSGSGKSDLALRLIDRGAKLISDDAVVIDVRDGVPILRQAPNIEGFIEIRGIGIKPVKSARSAPLIMVAELAGEVERMPPEAITTNIAGSDIPLIKIAPFEISAAIKLEYALRAVVDAAVLPVARIVPDEAESIEP